jgi:hypothetical protein
MASDRTALLHESLELSDLDGGEFFAVHGNLDWSCSKGISPRV